MQLPPANRSQSLGSKFSQIRNNKDFRAPAFPIMETCLALLLVISSVANPGLAGAPPPVWSRTYAVEGTLSIPYAEIEVTSFLLLLLLLLFRSLLLPGPILMQARVGLTTMAGWSRHSREPTSRSTAPWPRSSPLPMRLGKQNSRIDIYIFKSFPSK